MLSFLSGGLLGGSGHSQERGSTSPSCHDGLEDSGGERLLPLESGFGGSSPPQALPAMLTDRNLFAALSPSHGGSNLPKRSSRRTQTGNWTAFAAGSMSRVPDEPGDPRLCQQNVEEFERRMRLCADVAAHPCLDFDIDEYLDRVTVYKNHSLSRSTLLHFAIIKSASSKNEGSFYVRRILERGAEVRAKARYRNPNSTETEFEAIHIAAGLGCLDVLDCLLEFAVYRRASPGESASCASDYVSTWATIPDQPGGERNYLPIHDAAFGRQKGSIIWLLHHGADAGAVNLHGFTALHFLALNGLVDDKIEAIEDLVHILREHDKSGRVLNAKTFNNHYLMHFRSKIPLEFAATGGSQFPKDAMYLLAPSNWEAKDEPRFFEDLLLLANSNTTHAADALARKICEKASRGTAEGSLWRSRVRKEAQNWLFEPGLVDGSAILASLFFMVPNAAADMVDILVAKPLLQDAAKHPIPSRAILKAPQSFIPGGNQPMLCSYQPDATRFGDLLRPEWKFNAEEREVDQSHISWHRELVQEQPEHLVDRREDVHAVSVKVVLWADFLDLDIGRALACTPTKNDKIFSRLPVQAVAFWYWNNLGFPSFVLTWLLTLSEVVALVCWGLGNEGNSDQSYPFCRTVLLAGNIREAINLCWCFKQYTRRWWKYKRSKHHTVLRYLWEPKVYITENAVEVVSILLRATLLVFMDEQHLDSEEVDFGQALIAINVMIGFFHLTYMLRLLDGMGKGILAIWETFFSRTIQNMLFICGMFFVNFFLAFIMLAKDRDPTEVFLQLYRGFFFGDGGALDVLGLDVSGDKYARLLLGPMAVGMNRVLALLGTSFFTVIILNLMIAIYSTEYEKFTRDAELLFLKHRLRISCDFVVTHRKFSWGIPMCASLVGLPLLVFFGVDLFMLRPFISWHLALCRKSCLTASALMFALGQVFAQMIVVQGMGQQDQVHLQGHGGDPRFLWICHRSDFNSLAADLGLLATKEDLRHLTEEVHEQIGELSHTVQTLSRQMDEKFDKVLEYVKRVAEAQEAAFPPHFSSGSRSRHRGSNSCS